MSTASTIRSVLRAAAQRSPWRRVYGWGFATAALCTAALVGWLLGWQGDTAAATRALRIIAVLTAHLAIGGLWLLAAHGVLQQNTPALARLMPGHSSALWAGLVVSAAVVLAGLLTVQAVAVPAPVRPLAAFFSLLGMALALAVMRWVVVRVPVTMLGWTGGFWGRWLDRVGLQDPLARFWFAHEQVLVAGALLVLAVMTWTAVQRGGRRHRQHQSQTERRQRRWGGRSAIGVSGVRQPAPWLAATASWLLTHVPGLKRWSLDAVIARPGGHIASRLALGLGPQAHLGGMVAHQVVGLAFGLVVLGVVSWAVGDGAEMAPVWRIAASLAIAVMAMGTATTLHTAMRSSSREQALLRLLPGCPQGAALNRQLAVHHARLVLGTLACCGGISLLLGANLLEWRFAKPMLHTGYAMLLLCPWSLVSLWRDWSSTPRLGSAAGAASALGLALPWLGMPLSTAWVMWWGWPWWGLVALSTAGLLPVLVWRWRQLSNPAVSRAAWPMGRWAKPA